eukprot:TRINITY_DN4594_c0_g3_i1.p1 TRINITY_DN4594_c0_g3~~TRINITY_DN4594_c0_g3_i1.p1  ORF type:complete len:224 (-),score=34.83 TRINITY_DN4594_c0_g3_i1:86-724(-)
MSDARDEGGDENQGAPLAHLEQQPVIKERPRSMEVVFEINAPPEGEEEDPFFEAPEGANRSRIEFLKEELAKPHSVLRLRIKDKLEKAIAMDTVKSYDVPQEHITPPRPKYKTEFTVHGELALRNPPKSTGNAYMMKGFSAQTAPFMGVNYDPFTKDVEASRDSLPTFYQPFRADHEHPFGRHPPSPQKPCGGLRKPVERSDRVFTLARQPP